MAFGDVLIVSRNNDRVYRHDGSSWDSGFAVVTAETRPEGIAVDPENGDIIVVGRTTDRVYRYMNGAWDSGIAVPAGEDAPLGVAVDTSNGDILIIGGSDDRVYRHNGTSWDSGIATPTGLTNQRGLTLDPTNGDILFVDANSNLIYRHNGTEWDAGFAVPVDESQANGIAVDPDNGDILLTGSQNLIYRHNGTEWDAGFAVPVDALTASGVAVDGFNPATEPAQPDAPGLTVASRSSITVGFTDPDDGGSDITSRNMRYRQTGTATWVTLISQTFPYTITGLDFATEYDVQIQAVNAEGNSLWSDTATATTSANQAPTVTINTGTQVINGNSALTLSATATDPEGDSLTYLWSATLGSFTDTSVLNAVYNAPAPISSNQSATLTLRVTDEHGAVRSRTLVLGIRTNQTPSVTINTPAQSILSGSDLALDSTISDVDHPLSDLAVLWSAPMGTFSDTGIADPVWSSPAITENTDVILTLTVNDGVASAVVRTVTITVKPPLTLASYDQTGKSFEVLALIESSNRNDVFQQSTFPAMGTLLDGEVGVGPDETILNRIRITPSATRIILREDDLNIDGNAAVLDSRDYFLNGDGSDLTLTIVTVDGSVDIPIADNIDTSSGTNTTQLRVNIPTADRSVVNAIDDGDRFIIALWREGPTAVNVGEVSFNANAEFESNLHVTRHLSLEAEFNANATFDANVHVTRHVNVSMDASATFDARLNATRHLNSQFNADATFHVNLQPAVRAGNPEFTATAEFASTLTARAPKRLNANFEGSASFTADIVLIEPKRITASFEASASLVVEQPVAYVADAELVLDISALANFRAILSTSRISVAVPTPGADIVHQIRIASNASVRSISDENDTATFIRVQHNESLEWQSFVKFDLTSLPDIPVQFASLILKNSMNDGMHIGLFTEIHEVTESWAANSLTTWAGRPSIGDRYDQTSAYDDDGFILTSLIRKWKNSPSANYGLRISQPSVDSIERRFYAHSTIEARRPTLVVLLDDGLHLEYGTVIDHETDATGNPNLYNSRLLQFGERSESDHRPAPSLDSFGMVYLERTYGRISVDLGGGWRTILHTDRRDDDASPRTLGTGRYQASPYNHSHS